METIGQKARATYGFRPESVSAGFGCGLGCTLVPSVRHSAAAATVCGLWRYISATPLPFKRHSDKKVPFSGQKQRPVTKIYDKTNNHRDALRQSFEAYGVNKPC